MTAASEPTPSPMPPPVPASDPPHLTLRTPEDVLAKVPFLVGFHPQESLVALGVDGGRSSGFATRVDFPDRGGGRSAVRALGRYLAQVLAHNGAVAALLVAYTSDPARSRPLVRATSRALGQLDVRLLEVLRADGRRWWSETCTDPACCPADGVPYDLTTHPVTAASVYLGETALADEAEMRHTVAAPDGATRDAMLAMTDEVAEELSRRFARDPDPARAFLEAGRAYVCEVVGRQVREPGPLSDEDVARTIVFVLHLLVRDEAWTMMRRETAGRHVALWRDVVRRAVPPFDAAPAALLAFAAWLEGSGALARCALERAFASDPDYSMAHIIQELLLRAVPPTAWPPPPAGVVR